VAEAYDTTSGTWFDAYANPVARDIVVPMAATWFAGPAGLMLSQYVASQSRGSEQSAAQKKFMQELSSTVSAQRAADPQTNQTDYSFGISQVVDRFNQANAMDSALSSISKG
jgi:hypothetical protein